MDKFMKIYTSQYHNILATLNEYAWTRTHEDNSGSSDFSSFRCDGREILGDLKVQIHRSHLGHLNHQVTIKVTYDYEMIINDVITSDHQLARIMQIIRCLIPTLEEVRGEEMLDRWDNEGC